MRILERIRCVAEWTLLLVVGLLAVSEEGQAQGDMPETCSAWQVTEECSEGEHLQVNGISLYYELRGEGEPLLLMHHGDGSAENFNEVLPLLSNDFVVITPDSRAQGRSTDAEEALSYSRFVDDMIDLLDSLEIDSAYVGGMSDGAAIAIHMAMTHPERVRALVLGPVDLSPEALTDAFWEAVDRADLPEKLAELWFETRRPPAQEQLTGIQVPTLFVIGEEEQYVDLDHVAWQYGSIPDAEVTWIPGAGHFHYITHPDLVGEAIAAFLNEHRMRTR